ncbi:MAG TPA: filamentous hemagglutinin N-terminal domain-containing protein, partial [Verrucomicrobiae bacterium]
MLVFALSAATAPANPEGLTVAGGTASAVRSGSQLTVAASQNAVLNWQRFNIAPGETTTFVQPSAASVVWNRINDNAASLINGHLNANGFVVLFNQNGFYFGPNSVVNVGGMLVTASPMTAPDFLAGGPWQYNGPPPVASIINYGQLNAQKGGSIFLIAEKVENHGVMTAPDGTLGLYAGKDVLVSERPDGRGLSAHVRLPEGSVDNHGLLVASAGTIALHAQVVNQGGVIQADSVREHGGVIELVASERVNLEATSVLQANGDPAAQSDGGRITIKSGGAFADATGSTIAVRGGGLGGHGGSVEISAAQFPAIHSHIDGTARNPGQGGNLFIDPQDIVLGNTGGDIPDSTGTIPADNSPGAALQLNVSSAFQGFSHITLQATRDITVAANTVWDLSGSTGISDPGSQLTLQAGNNIVFGLNSGITAGSGWSVQLVAGAADFSSPNSTTVTPGTGSIWFNGSATSTTGNGYLQAHDGSVRLFAGKDILIGRGYVNTTGGGSITAVAAAGTVNTGTKVDGYTFSDAGYETSFNGLGGTSTVHGGDVNITAGTDIISLLPRSGNTTANTAATGAFGAEPGNVTLTAGHRVQGAYIVRNGTGTINAGVTQDGTQITSVFSPLADVGSASAPVALDLVSGRWRVWSAHDIFLQEVRNPNGVFNDFRSGDSLNGTPLPANLQNVRHLFDYAPDAAVQLTAGNAVNLLGANLPRIDPAMQAIYPPKVEITAGAGGISFNKSVVLYPSPSGSLDITTTSGGSLQGLLNAGSVLSITMSDSGSPDYNTFAAGHADSPLHLGSTDPVRVTIDGNLQNLLVQSPEATRIRVNGDAINFSFNGQNLHATDVSELSVGGSILNRLNRTYVEIQTKPDFSVLDSSVSLNPNAGNNLIFNETTGQLGYVGRMSIATRDYLLNPQVLHLDALGNPVLDAQGNPIYFPATFTTDAAAINKLYTDSLTIPAFQNRGYQIGGPGRLSITAQNLDLGISDGIRSVGPLNNAALAKLSRTGADLDIQLAHDLDMVASRIASVNGGTINLIAGGTLDVGTQEQFTSSSAPKGIYTTAGSAVNVVCEGDININGSRIATYDGGSLSILS